MKKSLIVGICLILLVLFPICYQAVAGDDEEDGGGDAKDGSELTFEGYLEMENFFNTSQNKDFEDSMKKNELRAKLKIRYGKDNAHFFLSPDFYVNSTLFKSESDKTSEYSEEFDITRNLRITDRGYEMTLNECYFHYGNSKVRMRIGNQVFGWGTADVFNPTAYFNPYDMRETLFKDENELRQGVPAVSGMMFFDSFTAEMVVVPFHIPGILPQKGSYWEIVLDNYKLPVEFADIKALDADAKNVGFGARMSSTVMGLDFSVSGYHGPDKDFLYLPTSIQIEEGEPVSALVTARTFLVTCLGLDMSKSWDKFVFQAEMAYTPNKSGYISQNTENTSDLVFPFAVKESGYISYSMGFNYFVPMVDWFPEHEGDTVFTMEWFQAKFLDSDFAKPILTDLISARFEDSYFKSRVPISLTCIVSVDKPGHVIWPKIGYDFQNGFSTSLSYLYVDGKSNAINTTESLFYYFRNNDSLLWKLHYDF